MGRSERGTESRRLTTASAEQRGSRCASRRYAGRERKPTFYLRVVADLILTAQTLALLNRARQAGFAAFGRWRNRDVFAHLKRLLNDQFEGDPFLAGQDWDFLQTRADIVEILDAFFVEQTPLRPALPAALTKRL